MAIFGSKRDAVEKAKREAEAEHAKVQAAAERVASEQRRIEEAQIATVEIDTRVKQSDPDEPRFARLVADRTTAQARVEALEVRAASARDALAAAEQKAAEADLRAWELEFADVKAAVIAEDAQAYETMYGARARIRKHVATLNDLIPRASELEEKIRRACDLEPRPAYQPRNQFGSGWASFGEDEENILQVAAGLVHQKDAEEYAEARERAAAEILAAREAR